MTARQNFVFAGARAVVLCQPLKGDVRGQQAEVWLAPQRPHTPRGSLLAMTSQ